MNPDWLRPADLKSATIIQREIAAAVETDDRIGQVSLIAGADTSSKWLDRHGPLHAAIAPLAWPDQAERPAASHSEVPPFAYVSGYLGFREAPALVAAWAKLPVKPDLLFVDGQGRAHPRRCGIASHLGVLLDIPTIGIAKTLLCGEPDGDRIVDRGETVALAITLHPRGRPIYVGNGHRLSLETARDWVLRVADGRRLPPPIRAAHDAANAARRAWDLTTARP